MNNTLKILIADDHAIVRKGLREILREWTISSDVTEAVNGKEALALGCNYDWDIVILDITMPGPNGLEVLRRLKRAKPTLCVIMLSMHANEQYVRRSLSYGAAGYLNKDSAPDELVAAIGAVLAGQTYLGHTLAAQP